MVDFAMLFFPSMGALCPALLDSHITFYSLRYNILAFLLMMFSDLLYTKAANHSILSVKNGSYFLCGVMRQPLSLVKSICKFVSLDIFNEGFHAFGEPFVFMINELLPDIDIHIDNVKMTQLSLCD